MHIDNRVSTNRLRQLQAKERVLHRRYQRKPTIEVLAQLQEVAKEIDFIKNYKNDEKHTKELASIVGIEYYD